MSNVKETEAPKNTIPTAAPSEDEVKQYKRRLIETASRSYINDRLNVSVPDHLHAEWIGTDDFSQFHAAHAGFVDGEEYLAEENKVFIKANGSVVGDVKLMVMPKWKYEAQQDVAKIESQRRSGLLGPDEAERIYKEYANEIGLPSLENETSTTRVISGTEVDKLIKR